MQLLLKQTTTDPAAWRAEMDADREAQRDAGLSLMQFWVDAADTNIRWALFEVNDRKRAQGWVVGFGAGMHKAAAITATEAHFVKTA